MALKFHFHIPVTLECCCVIVCSRVYTREVEASSKLACHLVIDYTLNNKSAILQQQSKKKTAGKKVQVKVELYLKRSVVSGMIPDPLF